MSVDKAGLSCNLAKGGWPGFVLKVFRLAGDEAMSEEENERWAGDQMNLEHESGEGMAAKRRENK